jgi:serine/threonine-protein kinase
VTIPAGTLVPRDARDFGAYELIAKLATGGMAEIFLARSTAKPVTPAILPGAEVNNVVVLKRILPHLAEDEHFVTMFRDEADLAAKLIHPNVCRVHALGHYAGTWFIAMEYLHGVALSRMMSRLSKAGKMLDVRIVAAIIVQACEGLHHAHEARGPDGQLLNVVHRDVSPPNIMVTGDGMVKLLDFGIAKARGANSKTRTGTVKGKNAYMSPEQILGKPLDRRSDIFALGAVMYEMLAIKRLFHRDSDFMTFKAITEEPIPDIRDRRPDLPAPLRAAIIQSLARDPNGRFATAKAFADAIRVAVSSLGGIATPADLARLLSQDFGDEMSARDEILKAADDPGAAPASAIPVAAGSAPTGPMSAPPLPRPPPIPQAAARGELPEQRSRRPSGPMPDSVPSMIVHAPSTKLQLPPGVGTPLAVPVVPAPLPAALPASLPQATQPVPKSELTPATPQAFPIMAPATTVPLASGLGAGDYTPWPVGPEPSTDLLRTYRRRSMIRGLIALGVGAALIAGLIVLVSSGGGDRRTTSRGVDPGPADAAVHAIDEPRELIDAGPSTRDNIEALSKFGFFSLSANAKTTIYMNGQRMGETPITRVPMPPGVYKVHAVGPKGKAKDLKVMIYGGKDTDEGVITW